MTLSKGFLASVVLAFTALGCSAAPDDPDWAETEISGVESVESVESVEQALGGTCPSCTSSSSCSQSCTVDTAQGLIPITCGQYGVCARPAPTSTVYTGGNKKHPYHRPPP